MVKVVQNNQNLQILFALQFPIRFSLKKYPSEMRSNHPKALLFYHFVRKIIHQWVVLPVGGWFINKSVISYKFYTVNSE
jgi:hypothetical protein